MYRFDYAGWPLGAMSPPKLTQRLIDDNRIVPLARPRRRLGVRPQHLEGVVVDDRRPAPDELRAPSDGARRVRVDDDDIAAAPQYFSHDAEMNRRGARALEEIAASPLTAADVAALLERGAIPLDVRDTQSFAAGHIPRSVNIGLDGQYASWCGTLFSPNERLGIVAEGEERSREAIMRLARVGMENVAGYVDGGILGWSGAGEACDQLPQTDVSELRTRRDDFEVVDVRRPTEFECGHVPGARSVPLSELQDREVRAGRPLAVICASGYRSAIASSLLARAGANVTNVIGGTAAWIQAGYEVAAGDGR